MIRLRELRFIIHEIRVDSIKVVGRHRQVNEKELEELKASIAEIGLQTPITVRFRKKRVELVAGLRRLKAMEQLGQEWIPCFEQYNEERESYFWRRSENLYRGGLRVLDRAEEIDELRQALLQEGQVAPPGGRQPADVGINKAAKRLGFTKEKVRRSKVIAAICPEAKAEARNLELDDNEDALLAVAKLPTSAQVAAVKAIVDRQKDTRAHLSSTAMLDNKEAGGKIEKIQALITKDKKALDQQKEKLAARRERLCKIQDELVQSAVNRALINNSGGTPTGPGAFLVQGRSPLSSEDEAVLKGVLAAWENAHELKRLLTAASVEVRERFGAMLPSMLPDPERLPALDDGGEASD
jgi:ParB/Sulfiredoxin domain